jgi:hypothetical protein
VLRLARDFIEGDTQAFASNRTESLSPASIVERGAIGIGERSLVRDWTGKGVEGGARLQEARVCVGLCGKGGRLVHWAETPILERDELSQVVGRDAPLVY